MPLDTVVFGFINSLSNKWWVFDYFGIFFAKYLAYFLVIFALIIILKERDAKNRFYYFSLASLSIILSRGLITEIIRFFYSRPRPFSVLGIEPLFNYSTVGSFPSGHAAAFFALALAIYFFNKKAGLWFLGLALLMGIARVFAGVHWPLDILAGALIGLASAFIVKNFILKKNSPLISV